MDLMISCDLQYGQKSMVSTEPCSSYVWKIVSILIGDFLIIICFVVLVNDEK